MKRAEIRLLAQHQPVEHLPYGIKCLCGAELSDLNGDPFNHLITGRGLAMAAHQAYELETLAEVLAHPLEHREAP